MSLINRMLKDIDTRTPASSAEPTSERVRQLSMTAAAARPVRSARLWWLGLLLAALGLACWFFF